MNQRGLASETKSSPSRSYGRIGPPEPLVPAKVGQTAIDTHPGPGTDQNRVGIGDRSRSAVESLLDHRLRAVQGMSRMSTSRDAVTAASGRSYFFLDQTADRSSDACSRIPLSERISSVALSAS